MKRTLLLLFTYCLASAPTSAQGWYEPDLAFGSSEGRFRSSASSEYRALARQSDGKYIAGGAYLNSGTRSFCLDQFDAGGNLIKSLRTAGADIGEIFDIVIGPADHIFVCGYSIVSGMEYGNVIEYDASGTLLRSISMQASTSMIYKIIRLADGSILAAGREMVSGEDRARIWKVKSDFTALVSGFGTSGVIKIEDANPYSWVKGFSSFYGIDVMPSGQILACGSYRTTATSIPQGFLSRWTSAGIKDDASGFYSTYNIATWNSSTAAYEYYDIAFHGSGLFLGGYKTSSGGFIRASGESMDYSSSLNTSHSGHGAVYNTGTPTPPYDAIVDLERLSDQSCVFLGNSGASATETQIWLGKLSSTLYIDTTFHRVAGKPGSHNYFLPLASGVTSEAGYDFWVNADSILIAGSSTKAGVPYATLTKLKYRKDASGVSESTVQHLPELYPNPAKEYVIVHLPFGAATASPALAVYNSLGQLVLSQQGGDRISVVNLPQGYYTVVADAKPIGRFVKE